MKDVFRNPTFYYILVPVVVGIWPLLVWAVYLPQSRKGYQKEETDFKKSQDVMLEILKLDPERGSDANEATAEFDYANAVDRAASSCRIPPSKYKVSTQMLMKTRGRKTQDATVSLKEVDMESFAKFLSTIQLRWGNLECNYIRLAGKKGLPDMWDVEIRFKYIY
jgi:hypothetical protein